MDGLKYKEDKKKNALLKISPQCSNSFIVRSNVEPTNNILRNKKQQKKVQK